MYYRAREMVQPSNDFEVDALIHEVPWAKQTLTNRSGFSPAQRVLGKNPEVHLDGESGLYETATPLSNVLRRSGQPPGKRW